MATSKQINVSIDDITSQKLDQLVERQSLDRGQRLTATELVRETILKLVDSSPLGVFRNRFYQFSDRDLYPGGRSVGGDGLREISLDYLDKASKIKLRRYDCLLVVDPENHVTRVEILFLVDGHWTIKAKELCSVLLPNDLLTPSEEFYEHKLYLTKERTIDAVSNLAKERHHKILDLEEIERLSSLLLPNLGRLYCYDYHLLGIFADSRTVLKFACNVPKKLGNFDLP